MKVVIICGGVGSKMWPLSREKNPKHFAKLIGDKSLFQLNYEALRQKFDPKDIFVQTNEAQANIAQGQVGEIPKENYFIEPERRNHGPAMGLMAAKLYQMAPDEPYVVVQADVIRKPVGKFLAMIEVMDKLIQKEGRLMTGGIKLDRVVGGIDFMVPGEDVGGVEGMRVFKMKRWVDRTDTNRDDEAIAKGQVYGHANHYAWTPRKMLEAYKRRAPEWYEPLVKMMEVMAPMVRCVSDSGVPSASRYPSGCGVPSAGEKRVIREEYAKMPSDPIEARVTKHELAGALVVELPFVWIDLGTWESVAEYGKGGESGLTIGGENNYVRSKKFVATVGVSDLVIVETEDAMLVMKKGRGGKVGQVVDWLKEKKKKDLL